MIKNILLTAIIGMTFTVNAQCILPYKSLAQFNNDTTAFITYNFSTRAACYVGKTMKDVLNDLGLPVVSFLTTNGYYNSSYDDGLYIYIYPYKTVRQYLYKKQAHNFIYVGWKTTILDSTLDALVDKSNIYKWTPQMADFLKDVEISRVGVVH